MAGATKEDEVQGEWFLQGSHQGTLLFSTIRMVMHRPRCMIAGRDPGISIFHFKNAQQVLCEQV